MFRLKYIFLTLLFYSITLNGQTIDTVVNVGDYSLHYRIIKGNGIPILFESGAGDDASIWNCILDSIYSKTGTTLITYDRAGFGKSGHLSRDMNIQEEIIGLEKGLNLLGFNNKIMLVSHSYGGFFSILFASRNPNKVVAYVAIDANLPCIFDEHRLNLINDILSAKKDSIRNANIGLYYLALSIEEDVVIVNKHPFPINIPVIDLVAQKQAIDSSLTINCHKDFVSQSNKRKFLLANNCGHYIFKDNSELVINIISDMYNRQIDLGN